MSTGVREVGDAIVRRRLQLDMSQEELAERAGVARDTVQALELGKRTNFRSKTKRKLDKALQWVPGEGIEALEAGREAREEQPANDDPETASVVELFTASFARLGELADQHGRAAKDPTVGTQWMTDVLELRERAFALVRRQSSENAQRYG
jgi:transcriptional regulator with XRE-family HTH domain